MPEPEGRKAWMGQEGKAGALLARIRVELAVSPCVSDAAKATYGELAKLVTPVLLASALKAAGNYPDAEAIVEKVLVDLWLGILRYKGHIQHPMAYVRKIVSNSIADHWELRKGSQHRRPEPALAAVSFDDERGGPAPPVDERAKDPADAAECGEACEILMSSLEGLDEQDREIALRIAQGQSLQETADDMGIGKGKVRYRFDKFALNMQRTILGKS